MDADITPAHVRRLRHLFEQVAGLPSDACAAFLGQSVSGQDALRRHVEALHALDAAADVVRRRLGEEGAVRGLQPWDRLLELLESLRTAPVARRQALAEASGGDERRYDTLVALFEAYEAFPERFTAAISEAPSRPAEGRAADGLVGTIMGPYRLVERLDRGSVSGVFRAVDTRHDRAVVLKFLPAHPTGGEEARARFIHEAHVVAALDHPNIGTLYDVERNEQGQWFVAMAHYAGETLREKIGGKPLPVAMALDYAVQIARGLQRAHEEGVVHGGLQPDAVLLTERGQVKLVDFGRTRLEEVGMRTLATLSYLSPEQAFGGAVDHRADLWALGVILYEMLTGRHPFLQEQGATLYALANHDPEDVRTLRPEVPPQLSSIVASLLRKEPARRYAHTADVVEDLRAAHRRMGQADPAPEAPTEQASPVPSQPGATWTFPRWRLPRWRPSRGVGKAVLAAVVLALAALAAVSWMERGAFDFPGGSTDAPTEAATPEAAAAAAAEAAAGLALLKDGAYGPAQQALERALRQDSTSARAWQGLTSLHLQQGRYDEAARHGRQALRYDSTSAPAHRDLGTALSHLGAVEEATRLLTRAIALDPAHTTAYGALADLYVSQGRPAEALRLLAQGAPTAKSPSHLALLYHVRGKAYLALGETGPAVEALQAALGLDPDRPGVRALLEEARR